LTGMDRQADHQLKDRIQRQTATDLQKGREIDRLTERQTD